MNEKNLPILPPPASEFSPSPGTPGEGRGEGLNSISRTTPIFTGALTPTLSRNTRRGGKSGSSRAGFTLVEVLATLMLMAIVFPVVMQGVTLSSGLADDARRRTQAAGLAETKLAEIIATNEWQQTNLSGDFGADTPGFRWQATASPWAQDTTNVGMQQIDVQVFWTARGHESSLEISTLAYNRVQQ